MQLNTAARAGMWCLNLYCIPVVYLEKYVCFCGMCVCANLVAVVDSRCDLSEDASSFCFRQSPPLLDVIVQLSSAGVLHHYHNLIPALEHCTGHIYRLALYRCLYKCVFIRGCLHCTTIRDAILHFASI